MFLRVCITGRIVNSGSHRTRRSATAEILREDSSLRSVGLDSFLISASASALPDRKFQSLTDVALVRDAAAARTALSNSSEIRNFTDFCLRMYSNGYGSRFPALMYFDKSESSSSSASLSLPQMSIHLWAHERSFSAQFGVAAVTRPIRTQRESLP